MTFVGRTSMLKYTRDIYIELPPEDAEEGMVEVLLRPMYGPCDAAMAFDRLATEVMEGAGYVMGCRPRASTGTSRNRRWPGDMETTSSLLESRTSWTT